jgi:Zn-dependent protease with chaperone function
MNVRRCLLASFLLVPIFSSSEPVSAESVSEGGRLQEAPPAVTQPPTSTTAERQQTPPQRITHYTLAPERYKKAHDLAKIQFRLALISFVYGLLILRWILRWKLSAKYRDWAERLSSKRFVQALVFSPLLILTIAVFELPTGIYQNWILRQYGLSVQGWGSWFWDWTKGQLLFVLLATLLIWILYEVIRKSPRRWWLYFWIVSLPIGLIVFFVEPLIIDPLFNKFEPLAQKDPVLTTSLEKLVQRAGQNIPRERMFWMGASEKTTAVDAYVTGFGASKRIVVLDTTIAKATNAQILFVAGHEIGHYVLGHIPKGIAFFALLFLLFFYAGYRLINWVLAEWGAHWGVRSLDDWASLPALLLLLSIFTFVANPISSAFSRHIEHQADQYGLEVTHGLTPDSGQVAAQTFLMLGDVDLGDPEPNPADVFLFYSHPPLPDRVLFAVNYDPWSKGQEPEFVK